MPTCTLSHCPYCVRMIQSQPRVFSAGLDILEMYRKSPERCGEFWRAVQEMWLKLYSSNMVTIAAINVGIYYKPQQYKIFYLTCTVHVHFTWGCGLHSLVNPYRPVFAYFVLLQGSSPAGGCLMSMTCDYRIMVDNPRYSIGLNETQLGIVAPFWSGTPYRTKPMMILVLLFKMNQTAADTPDSLE